MEDYTKDSAATTSSNFFEPFGKGNPLPALQNQKQAPKFFQQSIGNENRIQQLESRMMALDSILDQLKDHFDKVNSDTTLDDSHNDRMVNLEQLKNTNEAIERQLKRNICDKFQRLDRELKEMERNRKEVKSKYDTLLSDGLEEVKTIKQVTYKELKQLKELKGQQLKYKNVLLKKQLQKLKKSERNFKSSILGNLEMTRNKFHERVRNEENKRNNLENIIQFLLEKTCKKAQDTMQRRLYQQHNCSL